MRVYTHSVRFLSVPERGGSRGSGEKRGAKGRCLIEINKYQKDGKDRENNRIKSFLEPPSNGVHIEPEQDELPPF